MKRYLVFVLLVVIGLSGASVAFGQGVVKKPMKGRFSMDFKISNRWSQKGILFGNAMEEYVVPKRKTELGEHIGYELGTGYYLTNNFLLQLNLGYYNNNIQNYGALVDLDGSMYSIDPVVTEDEFYMGLGVGEFTEIPVTFEADWVFRAQQKFKILAGIGLGYSFIDLKEEDLNAQVAKYRFIDMDLATPIDAPTFEVTADDSFIYYAKLGVDIDLTNHWTLSVDSRYLYGSDDVEIKLMHGGSEHDVLWLRGENGGTNGAQIFPIQQPERWQFKGGNIPLERWEMTLGVKYVFGGKDKEKSLPPAIEPESK